MRRRWGFLGLLVLVLAGCTSHGSDLDRLWEQGYGSNNPNVARIRSGQKPLHMDGSKSTWYDP